MDIIDVRELHYISHVDNLPSIVTHGLLSYNKAKKLKSISVADPLIQERRENVKIPGLNKPLHDFVNLYFNARNAMMYKRRGIHNQLTVLSISNSILNIGGTIITDGNASGRYTRFYQSPEGLDHLRKDLVFNRYWDHDNEIEKMRLRSKVCAEVLVPESIKPDWIQKIYVSNQDTLLKVKSLLSDSALSSRIEMNKDIFFM